MILFEVNQPKAKFTDEGVLEDALICGFESCNGYNYLKKSFPLDQYENCRSYINHPKSFGGKPEHRKAEDFIGSWSNVYLTENQLRGKFSAVTKHPIFPMIKEDFEKGLGGYGFSHVVSARKNHKGDIEEIEKVWEVDLCTYPLGTTETLMEIYMEDDEKKNTLMEIYDSDMEPKEKFGKLVEHCAACCGLSEEECHNYFMKETKQEEAPKNTELVKEEYVTEIADLKNRISELEKINSLKMKYNTPISEVLVETNEYSSFENIKNKLKG